MSNNNDNITNQSNNLTANVVASTLTFSWENVAAATIVFVSAFISLIINAAYGLFAQRSTTLNRQLAKLTVSLVISDCCGLCIFAFWTAPMTLWSGGANLSQSFLGKQVGQFGMLGWFGSLYSMFAIACNRCIAITKPMDYKTIFSTRNTNAFLTVLWVIILAQTAVYFHPECYIYYVPELLVYMKVHISYYWTYAETWCGAEISTFWQDQVYTVAMVFGILAINIITFANIRRMNQKVSGIGEEEAKKRQKGEVRFFAQACLNTFFFDFCILCFTWVSTFATEKWGWFWTTIMPWLMSHASNGLVIVNQSTGYGIGKPSLRYWAYQNFCCATDMAGCAAAPIRYPYVATISFIYNFSIIAAVYLPAFRNFLLRRPEKKTLVKTVNTTQQKI